MISDTSNQTKDFSTFEHCSGREHTCDNLDERGWCRSATTYKIKVGRIDMTLCPHCLGSLRRMIEQHDSMFRGLDF